MNEAMDYLAGLSAIGVITLVVWVIKWFLAFKKNLKEELLDPVLGPINTKITSLEQEVTALKANDKDMAEKVEKQFNAIKEAQAITNQSIAKMQGSLDIIITRLEK